MNDLRVFGMSYPALCARLVAVLVEQMGGSCTVRIAPLRKLEPNNRLAFTLSDDESQITVNVIASGVQEAPLLPLFQPRPETAEPASPGPMRVIRRTPEEEEALIQKKVEEAFERQRILAEMQAARSSVQMPVGTI